MFWTKTNREPTFQELVRTAAIEAEVAARAATREKQRLLLANALAMTDPHKRHEALAELNRQVNGDSGW